MTRGASPEPKAAPSAQVMMIGNRNDQNSASGSRRNSRNRVRVSSTSGWLTIAQMSSSQRHEHVFERRAVRGEQRQRRLPMTQRVQQCGQRQMDFGSRERQ